MSMYAGLRGMASGAFVQELWFAGLPVVDVWEVGTKLYPDERTLVRDLVLTPSADVYWVHLQESLRLGRGGVQAELLIGGQRFNLGGGDGTLPVLEYVGGAWRAETADGLLLHECVGAEVVVRARVPERTLALAVPVLSNCDVCELPVLPVLDGTRVRWRQWGNKRHAHGYGYVSAASVVSGDVFCQVNSYTSGRTERSQEFVLNGGPLEDNGSVLRVWYVCTKYSGGTKNYSVVYPAFEKEWHLRVAGCTLQHKVN